VFIGKDGLRAGWSLLIYVVILVAIGFSVTLIAQKIHPRPNPSEMAKITQNVPPRFLLLNEAIPFFMVLLVTWIMSKIERRPNSVYGFGGSRKLTHFLAGLAWGVTCLSLLVLILWKTRFLVIDSRLVFGSDILRYGAIWLFGFLLVGLFEEYLLRGYLQYTLSRGLTGLYQVIFKSRHSTALGFWTAALLLSTLFGLGHGSNPGESPIGLLSAGLAGLLFCFALWRTGSLWWAIGFHTSWDLGPVLSLRSGRQRHDGAAPSSRHARGRQAHPERRSDWSGRQYLRRRGLCRGQRDYCFHAAPCPLRRLAEAVH